jgi:hypothetical protein
LSRNFWDFNLKSNISETISDAVTKDVYMPREHELNSLEDEHTGLGHAFRDVLDAVASYR